MAFQRQRTVGTTESVWPRILIAVIIGTLAVSLVTRFTGSETAQIHIAQSVKHQTADSRRQHLDKDAISWISPAGTVTLEAVPVLFAQVIPTPPLCSHMLLGESLYFRPPPF